MAISTYDEQFLNDEQKKQLQAFTDAWNRANAAGDTAGMESAHAAAERLRAQAGNYSGGGEGDRFLDLGGTGSGGYGSAPSMPSYTPSPAPERYTPAAAPDVYTPSQLQSYEAQTDAVNQLYDAQREAALAQLKSAYEANASTLESQRAQIPGVFQDQRNAAAAQSEVAGRSFNEYAAASGLNSGAGGQAALARSNQLQGDINSLNKAEAQAQLDLESQIAQLKIQYQNSIAQAVADGEYQRAAALLEEYQRAAESAVTVSQAQAGENYRAWQSQLERAQWEADENYRAWQSGVANSQWTADENYRAYQAAAAQRQQEYDNQVTQWQRQLEEAQLAAQYGDYSGLRSMGVDTSAYEAQLAAARAAAQTGSRSSGGSVSGNTTSTGWVSDIERMRAAGVKTGADAYSWALANGYSSTEAKQMQANWEEVNKAPEEYTPRLTYAVVPVRALIASNDVYGNVNRAYPAELQPRDRSRTASQLQMSSMAKSLNPALLMESPTAQNGSPIVRADGVVLGGNARTSAIMQAYQNGTAGEYEAAVRENAARFGIDPASIPENPVLVRVAQGEDWAGLARDLNSTTVSAYSATEQAQVDAEKIGDIIGLLVPDDNGNINTAQNSDFISDFVNSVADGAERNGLVTPRGKLSQEGLRRVQYAIFSYAYGDTDLVERLAESNDNDAKNVTNALLAAASNAAFVNDGIDNGELYNFDVTGRIVDAVNLYLEAKEKGMTVQELSEQMSIFGDSNAVSLSIAESVERYKNSGKKIRELFNSIFDAVKEQGSPSQESMFGAGAIPTSEDILRGASGIYEQRTGEQIEFGTGRYSGSQEVGERVRRTGTARSDTGESNYGPGISEVPAYIGAGGGEPGGGYGGVTAQGTADEGTLPEGIGAASAGFAQSDYNDWVNNAESFHPEGENAARNPSLPTRNLEGRKTSKVGQTIMEAENTPDERVVDVQNEYLNGKFTINTRTNAGLVRDAAAKYNENPDAALKSWSGDVKSGKVSNELVAMGAVILDSDKVRNNEELFVDVLTDYVQLCSTAGQALQAQRIFKALSPEGRLYAIKKAADSLGNDIGEQLTIDADMAEELLKAKSDEATDASLDKIYQSLADQLPASLSEKWTALRYMNMLGNFKTQVRNIIGNSTMTGMRAIKDEVATAIESVAARVNPDMERTRSARVGKAWMDAAKEDFENVREAAQGNGRYDDTSRTAIEQEIQSRRQIFKARPLEAYRKITNWATNVGDDIFIKHHYARALAGYLKANGVQVEQFREGNVDQQLLNRATDYAIKEAQEATFHDNNTFSNWISKMGRRKDTPKIGRIIGEGLAPFRKTPANVLVRAYEYSPAGIIDTAITAAKAVRGDATASDIINSAARTLTGSGIMALGFALRAAGCLRSTGDSDDEDVDALMNRQDYSIVIPGKGTFTIDWLTPATMPMFMGSNLWDVLNDSELSLSDADAVIARFTEPILETSMLSGVNDAIASVQYSENHLGQMAASFGLSWLTQGLTNSLLGQVERAAERNRMTTYTSADNPLPDWLERTAGQASAKIPGLDFQQTEYLDEFGNTESNGSVAERIFENVFSPGYWTPTHEGEELYDALQGIHDETGANPWPDTSPPKSFTVAGEKYGLSQDDKEAYQRTQGGLYTDLAGELVSEGSDQFTAQELADILSDIRSYAASRARKDFFEANDIAGEVSENYIAKAVAGTREADIPFVTYMGYYAAKGSLEYEKGKSGAKKAAVMELINGMDLTREQKDWLYLEEGYSEKTINDAPWH